MYRSFPALVKINYNLCRVTEMYKLCTANYRTTLFTTFSASRINIDVREEKNSGTDDSLTDIEGNFQGNLSEGWGETKFSRLRACSYDPAYRDVSLTDDLASYLFSYKILNCVHMRKRAGPLAEISFEFAEIIGTRDENFSI